MRKLHDPKWLETGSGWMTANSEVIRELSKFLAPSHRIARCDQAILTHTIMWCQLFQVGLGTMTVLPQVWRAAYRAVLLFVAYVALAAPALGQETDARHEATAKLPEFEVATIKPHPKGPHFFTVAWPPGRFEAKNVTAKLLVEQAFNVPDDQVSGEPDWADSQHFDVAAKIDDAQLAEISE